jgi:Xaa-Pro aminopeptidase
MNDERYSVRMTRVAEIATEEGFDAVVVAPSPDLEYLTGYAPMPLERPTLLVLRAGDPPTLLVPALERALAAACPAAGDLELVPWLDGVDPYAEASRLLPAVGRVATGDRLWASHLLGLQSAAPGLTFAPASPVVGRVRAVKDAAELDVLRRAGAAADATFEDVCAGRFIGRREDEVAADLARLLVANGHARAEFTIVASGPNAASPHHEPGHRTIGPGDAVVMDFGGELEGYFSDTTRTVVAAEASEALADVHTVVRAAQDAAIDVVRPGVQMQEVDRAARAVIEAAGHGGRFIHRTGHGIGREVHEPPYAVEGDRTVLEEGMTFSVEPGIYLEGSFGVRIEDIVAVTHDGVERLNRSPRRLRVVS